MPVTEETAIEQFKVRRLIQTLDGAQGHGTLLVTLMLKPEHDINMTNKLLTQDFGTPASIKSGVASGSAFSAIGSVQQRLKLYSKTPENGLVIYCGKVQTLEGRETKLCIDFEPFKPIDQNVFHFHDKFYTAPLKALLEDDDTYGFVIVDGNGALLGTLRGNRREVLHKISVDLPKKHTRGGNSALRFARLRLEKRRKYIREVGELATQHFIPNGETPCVKGLVVAGSGEFKDQLLSSAEIFDERLASIVIQPLLDTACGGEAGFDQAIELAAGAVKGGKFLAEKKLLSSFVTEVATDSSRCCFGIAETMQDLEAGVVETLIVWENLEIRRLVLHDPLAEKDQVVYTTPEQGKLLPPQRDMEVRDAELVLDWILQHYKSFGARLVLVSDSTQEGSQFCAELGGIGGLRRCTNDVQRQDLSDQIASPAVM
mmetsp:Transcript_70806/g.169518  ORF Transcript_70806/g.169518 Transcript_70806/m.169518 type:complete len:429 (+) Transcript_70806:86-1372(+)|eukprot:CAMPEP_0178431466 /NCGR_PEP_ID=MMETSP0689_2-20121128/31861_1 /TAXON_ID=160604 /ORGANISM="Amphidinium massartii, Strain CS-259" /LENGTH=428 /DNA_ID=CAMNT_0020053377 /DNA_START=66 /DNA_END=1352 /DNA_ORIENTATION=-